MRNYPKALKRKLLDTICQMREDLSAYVTDPKRDFTRSRKLPFETLCRTILSMSGQSLNVELQRQFHYDPTAATASADRSPAAISPTMATSSTKGTLTGNTSSTAATLPRVVLLRRVGHEHDSSGREAKEAPGARIEILVDVFAQHGE